MFINILHKIKMKDLIDTISENMDNTQLYEIKRGGKWELVRATSMMVLDKWCDENGIKDWRVAGMMSRGELHLYKNLPVVA